MQKSCNRSTITEQTHLMRFIGRACAYIEHWMELTMNEPEDDFVDSGPFCIHWSDPCDCEEKCAACGHSCAEHGGGHECNVDGCDCEEFKQGIEP